MKIQIIKASIDIKIPNLLYQLAELFDQYRVFYEQESDIASAIIFLSERLNKNDSTIFVAYDKNMEIALGFIQLYPSFTSIGMQRIFILNDLYIKSEYRRNSIAKQLIECAHKFSIENNAKKIVLMTAFNNEVAQQLYESIGYKPDTTFKNYYFELL
jgi:ribosomal protein S18 acetylase RimI-like enzyme